MLLTTSIIKQLNLNVYLFIYLFIFASFFSSILCHVALILSDTWICNIIVIKVREKYNLAPQTIIISPNGPPNYQNLWKMPILAKYPHKTPATCHFSIKKKSKSKNSQKKTKIWFLNLILFLFF
jgi:hypothetical protein